MVRALIASLFVLCLHAQIDALAGNFSGDKVNLKLQRSGSGQYSGSLEFGGQTFPVAARASGGGLEGTFTSQGHPFPFSASVDGNRMRFVTEGVEYALHRMANPEGLFGGARPLGGAGLLGGSGAPDRAAPSVSGGLVTGPGPATRSNGTPHRHSSGIGMRLPAGWTVTDNAQSSLLSPPGSNIDPNRSDNQEVYAVTVYDGYTPADEPKMVAELRNGLAKIGTTAQGGIRQPLSANGRQGSGYAWEFTNPENRRQLMLRIYLVPDGSRALVAFALGEASRIRVTDGGLREVAASLDFEAPKISGMSDGSAVTAPWLTKFRGMMLTQMSSSANHTSKKIIMLNSNGSYTYNYNSLFSASVGQFGQAPDVSASSIGRDNKSGQWRVVDRNGQPHLELRAANGEVSLLRITAQGNQTYLNGVRTFVTPPQ